MSLKFTTPPEKKGAVAMQMSDSNIQKILCQSDSNEACNLPFESAHETLAFHQAKMSFKDREAL